MVGQSAHKAGQSISESGVAAGLGRPIGHARDLRPQPENGPSRRQEVIAQGCEIRHLLAREIEAPSGDHAFQQRRRKPVGGSSRSERLQYGVIAAPAGKRPCQRLPPPFQPDLAKLRFADQFGDLRDFQMEGVEREQIGAERFGRKQRAQ